MVSSALLVYPLSEFAILTAGLTVGAFGAAGLSLWRHSDWAVIAGLALAIHGLISFTAAFSGLLVLFFVLSAFAWRTLSRRRTITVLTMIGAVVALTWTLVYLVTGFDIAACVVQSIANNRTTMTSEVAADATRYVLRASGNLLAYGAYLPVLTGLFAMAGTVVAVSRQRAGGGDKRIAVAACAVGLTLLAA